VKAEGRPAKLRYELLRGRLAAVPEACTGKAAAETSTHSHAIQPCKRGWRRHVITRSEEETIAFARAFASELRPGSVVLLVGDLGAGKTTFVRGLALGLGLDADAVSSPTFTLIQEHRGHRPLYHVDLYRLQGAEIEDLGLEELSAGDAIVAIEWAEKLSERPAGAYEVRFADWGDDVREITIAGPEPASGSGLQAPGQG
jgi:tRNA threonylcarbamoyladenosine biosynthesis protein TsaE